MDYKPRKTTCSRCQVNPRRKGQRYCQQCNRDKRAEERRREGEVHRRVSMRLLERGIDLNALMTEEQAKLWQEIRTTRERAKVGA